MHSVIFTLIIDQEFIEENFLQILDADVFLINPSTLRNLVQKGEAVVAPLLKSDGMYSNFWAGMTAEYYYIRTDLYEPILFREKTGCHHVPMVHSAVLVDLRTRESDRLTYKADKLDAYNGPQDDIITFAVGANKSGRYMSSLNRFVRIESIICKIIHFFCFRFSSHAISLDRFPITFSNLILINENLSSSLSIKKIFFK
jgi:hypothetical protein